VYARKVVREAHRYAQGVPRAGLTQTRIRSCPVLGRFGAPSGVAEDTKRPAEAGPVDPEFEAKKAKRAERFK